MITSKTKVTENFEIEIFEERRRRERQLRREDIKLSTN